MKTYIQNKEDEEIQEEVPVDICCICGGVDEAGSMKSVNDIDFELLCEICSAKRCTGCNWLRSKMKFGDPRYFCRHRGCIENPKEKVCDHWEVTDENDSSGTVLDDYS